MRSSPDVRVVSIGALSAHPLWGERAPVRTGHTTTTLVRTGEASILVDPGLPAPALVARLHERAGLSPQDITHVFLTSFHPETHRALSAFPDARWLVHEPERESIGVGMAQRLRELALRDAEPRTEDAELQRRTLEQEVSLLERCEPAGDHLVEGVALFPLAGVTPGLCGLLVEHARFTYLLCGDAIPSVEHLDQGKVLPFAADVDRARESFQEAIEIADLLVLGRDNIALSPGRRPF